MDDNELRVLARNRANAVVSSYEEYEEALGTQDSDYLQTLIIWELERAYQRLGVWKKGKTKRGA